MKTKQISRTGSIQTICDTGDPVISDLKCRWERVVSERIRATGFLTSDQLEIFETMFIFLPFFNSFPCGPHPFHSHSCSKKKKKNRYAAILTEFVRTNVSCKVNLQIKKIYNNPILMSKMCLLKDSSSRNNTQSH